MAECIGCCKKDKYSGRKPITIRFPPAITIKIGHMPSFFYRNLLAKRNFTNSTHVQRKRNLHCREQTHQRRQGYALTLLQPGYLRFLHTDFLTQLFLSKILGKTRLLDCPSFCLIGL